MSRQLTAPLIPPPFGFMVQSAPCLPPLTCALFPDLFSLLVSVFFASFQVSPRQHWINTSSTVCQCFLELSRRASTSCKLISFSVPVPDVNSLLPATLTFGPSHVLLLLRHPAPHPHPTHYIQEGSDSQPPTPPITTPDCVVVQLRAASKASFASKARTSNRFMCSARLLKFECDRSKRK